MQSDMNRQVSSLIPHLDNNSVHSIELQVLLCLQSVIRFFQGAKRSITQANLLLVYATRACSTHRTIGLTGQQGEAPHIPSCETETDQDAFEARKEVTDEYKTE